MGYALVLVLGVASWFGRVEVEPGSSGTIFAAPVALFEIILLPAWLLLKGFSLPDPAATNPAQQP